MREVGGCVGTEVGGEAQFQMAWVTGRQNMTSGWQ
jgi:hypothetical protein